MARCALEDEKREGLPDIHALSVSERTEFQADLLIHEESFKPLGERVMSLLANGVSPPKIQALTGVTADVVRRIRDLNPRFLRSIKETLATNLAEASQIMTEQLIEKAALMPPEFLAKSIAATIDKYQLLSGGVTARTEIRNISSPEDLQKMFESLPEAQATVVEENKNGSTLLSDH